MSGRGGNIGFSNQEFLNSALGKATVKAVNDIVQQLSSYDVPESGRTHRMADAANKIAAEAQAAIQALKQTAGKVLAVVNKSTVIVSLGSKHGYKNGDKLKVYEVVETKDDKGTVVFTEEKFAGDLVLDSVQDERSKGTYAGTAEVKSGWTVKAQ